MGEHRDVAHITNLETELGGAKKALGERATEFAQFRKLNEEQLGKLTVAERTIYENGLALEEQRQKNLKLEGERTQAAIDTAIRAKVGTDDKLFAKVKEMWPVVAIETVTPQDIERKTLAVLGVIGTTEPDMVASVAGFGGGSYKPPVVKKEGEVAFGETEACKAAANELGLITEPPKKA